MSATQQMLNDLNKGKVIKTDLKTCLKYGVTSIPDLARKIKNMGVPIEPDYYFIEKDGRNVRVAKYCLTNTQQGSH